MTQGSMDEALLKGQNLAEKTTLNQERTKDITEADALQGLDNAVQMIEANPNNPAFAAMAKDALLKLGIPEDGYQAIMAAAAEGGKGPAEILKTVREQYIQNKARTPKFTEKALLQEQKDEAAMKRVTAKLSQATEVEKIKAAAKQAAVTAQQGKMNFQQALYANIAQIYSDPLERITAIQIAQQYQGEVQRYVTSGLNLDRDESGKMQVTPPVAPIPPTMPQRGAPPSVTPPQQPGQFNRGTTGQIGGTPTQPAGTFEAPLFNEAKQPALRAKVEAKNKIKYPPGTMFFEFKDDQGYGIKIVTPK
jgi:hypothetical protein